MKNNTQKKYIILLIIFTIAIICNIFVLMKWNIDRKKNADEMKKIEQISNVTEIEYSKSTELVNSPDDRSDSYWNYISLPFIDIDLEELKRINSDTVGFIRLNGTNINYPVVQAKDNYYYLKHSFKKETNKAGWIFADYRNNLETLDNNTIIYGHNMLDGSMFGRLKDILKSDWLDNKNNYVVNFSTLTKNTLWQVFSVYVIPVETYYTNTNFSNDKNYQDWLNTIIKRSIYDFNTNVNTADKILTLSTCYRGNKRVVLHARLIKVDPIHRQHYNKSLSIFIY